MYGGEWIGKEVEVVNRTVSLMDGAVKHSTPDHLIGKVGECITAYDDRYDSSYLTGYETITLVVKTDEGKEYEVPSYFCVLKGTYHVCES